MQWKRDEADLVVVLDGESKVVTSEFDPFRMAWNSTISLFIGAKPFLQGKLVDSTGFVLRM